MGGKLGRWMRGEGGDVVGLQAKSEEYYARTLATILPDGSVGPAAAESWEVSDDASRYVFHLRPGLRFSNGDPVTAEDFKYAWRRAILPDTAATYSSLFLGIAGARDFFNWRSDLLALRAAPDRRDELVDAGSFSAEEADAILAEDGESSFRRTLERFDEMVGLDAVDPHTLEVELAPGAVADDVRRAVKGRVRETTGMEHVTVEVTAGVERRTG